MTDLIIGLIAFLVVFLIGLGIGSAIFKHPFPGVILGLVFIYLLYSWSKDFETVNAEIQNIELEINDENNLNPVNIIFVNDIYYLVYSYDIISLSNNDGTHIVNLELTVESVDIIQSKLIESNSGDTSELTFYNTSGSLSKKTTVTIILPVVENSIKNNFIIIQLKPLISGTTEVRYVFDSSTVTFQSSEYLEAYYELTIND
jgi:hypothetical protein